MSPRRRIILGLGGLLLGLALVGTGYLLGRDTSPTVEAAGTEAVPVAHCLRLTPSSRPDCFATRDACLDSARSYDDRPAPRCYGVAEAWTIRDATDRNPGSDLYYSTYKECLDGREAVIGLHRRTGSIVSACRPVR